MRWTIAATLLALGTLPAAAIDCPPGAYAWVGSRGIEYCKRDIIGPREDAGRPDAEACPAGTRQVTDRRGVRTCRQITSGSR